MSGVRDTCLDDSPSSRESMEGQGAKRGLTFADAPDGASLAKVLGKTELLAIGIGAIVGSGIFVVPGAAAAQFAGPAVALSFVVAAIACALAGLCYAELAAMFPVAGGAYMYARISFGRAAGWLVGWLLLLEYLLAAAVVGVGWSGYFSSTLRYWGVTIPPALTQAPIAVDAAGLTQKGAGLLNLPAVILIAIIGVVARRNVKLSATVNTVITFIKVGIIILVLIAGFCFVEPTNWKPFIPRNTGRWGEFGYSGIIRGAAVTFFVYLGFDAVSIAAQEARRPQHDVPFGILGSLFICTAMFVPMSLVLTGLTSYRNLNVPDPVAVAVRAAGAHLSWLVPLVSIGALVGMVSVLLVVVMTQARLVYAMALDGLMPEPLCRLHPLYRTPVTATIAVACVAATLAACLPISLLTQMVSFGALSAFVAVAAAVVALRRTHPLAERPFRTPFVPFVPIMAMLVCGYLLLGLPPSVWRRGCAWLLVGISLYLSYGRRRHRQRVRDVAGDS